MKGTRLLMMFLLDVLCFLFEVEGKIIIGEDSLGAEVG